MCAVWSTTDERRAGGSFSWYTEEVIAPRVAEQTLTARIVVPGVRGYCNLWGKRTVEPRFMVCPYCGKVARDRTRETAGHAALPMCVIMG